MHAFMSSKSISTLVEKIKNGDNGTPITMADNPNHPDILELFDQLHSLALSLLRTRIRDTHAVDDIAQNACKEAARRFDAFQLGGTTYIQHFRQICKQQWIDHVRAVQAQKRGGSDKKQEPLDDQFIDPHHPIEEMIEREEYEYGSKLIRRAERALAKQPQSKRQQEVWKLRKKGLSNQEVVDKLNISRATASVAFTRACSNMQKFIEESRSEQPSLLR